MARVGRVYGISSPDGVLRYVGSTEDDARMQKHRYNCRNDHLCCPFYRYAHEHHGGLDTYTEETLATLQLPTADGQAKANLRSLEALVIRSLRERDSPTVSLLNKNSPRAENVRKREHGRAWREQHGQGQIDPATGKSLSYMAVRSRIYRQRRKDRAAIALAAAAAAAESAQ